MKIIETILKQKNGKKDVSKYSIIGKDYSSYWFKEQMPSFSTSMIKKFSQGYHRQ